MNNSNNGIQGRGILNLSWESAISTDYTGDFASLDDFSMSSLNPSDEKQKIAFVLFESGEVELTIEHLSQNEGIKIPHQDLADDRPPVKKTVIFGGMISLYDGGGSLIASEPMDKLDYSKLLADIKKIKQENKPEEIAKVLKDFQSKFFGNNLANFLDQIRGSNPIVRQMEEFQIVEENENFVTIRVDLKVFEPGLFGSNVMLIDKENNRMLANRMYDEADEITQTTFYGYAKGDVQALDAIRVEEPILIQGTTKITKVTLTKISDLSISLN